MLARGHAHAVDRLDRQVGGVPRLGHLAGAGLALGERAPRQRQHLAVAQCGRGLLGAFGQHQCARDRTVLEGDQRQHVREVRLRHAVAELRRAQHAGVQFGHGVLAGARRAARVHPQHPRREQVGFAAGCAEQLLDAVDVAQRVGLEADRRQPQAHACRLQPRVAAAAGELGRAPQGLGAVGHVVEGPEHDRRRQLDLARHRRRRTGRQRLDGLGQRRHGRVAAGVLGEAARPQRQGQRALRVVAERGGEAHCVGGGGDAGDHVVAQQRLGLGAQCGAARAAVRGLRGRRARGEHQLLGGGHGREQQQQRQQRRQQRRPRPAAATTGHRHGGRRTRRPRR